MKNQQKGYIVPLVIAIIAILAIGSGVYIYNKNKQNAEINRIIQATSTNQITNTSTSTNSNVAQRTTTTEASQSECKGENDPNYNLGYGIEHTYNGNIKANMPIKIVLSCDHTTFTITGSVNQTITTKDAVRFEGQGEDSELADLSSGTEVVDVDTDYNFDGYNDLSTIISNGQGVNQVDSYNIFLYNPISKKFVFNKDLSAIENISVYNNQVTAGAYYKNGYKTTYYSWNNGKIVEGKTVVTCTDKTQDPQDLDGICK